MREPSIIPIGRIALKKECHALLDQMFGTHKGGQARAYIWLHEEFGRPIHFANIENTSELTVIWVRLWEESLVRKKRARFKVKPRFPRVPNTPPDPNSKKSQAKLNNEKYRIAPNALELGKLASQLNSHIPKRKTLLEKILTKDWWLTRP